jgi:hypothetical protein
MDERSAKYKMLKREYESLSQELKDVKNELESLREEYSENTVIQSMNDMRDKYQELLRTSVPKENYNELLMQKVKYVDHIKAIGILFNNFSKFVEPTQYTLSIRIKLLNEIISDILYPY